MATKAWERVREKVTVLGVDFEIDPYVYGYVSVDASGDVWAYTTMPTVSLEYGVWAVTCGIRHIIRGLSLKTNDDWTQSLTETPSHKRGNTNRYKCRVDRNQYAELSM